MEPSAWAVFFTVTERDGSTTELHWDLVRDDNAATETGMFVQLRRQYATSSGLEWATARSWEIYRDQYPSKPEGMSGLDFTLSRLIPDWNQYIMDNFDIGSGGHPVDEAVYQELKLRLVFNSATNQFEE